MRLELTTSSLATKCSTTELHPRTGDRYLARLIIGVNLFFPDRFHDTGPEQVIDTSDE